MKTLGGIGLGVAIVLTVVLGLSVNAQQSQLTQSTLNSGWNIGISPTDGTDATWRDGGGLHSYPYNQSVANGRLGTVMNTAAVATTGTQPNGAACSSASSPLMATSAVFTPGASALSLATAPSGVGFNCPYRFSNIHLQQSIPAYQQPGDYTIDMTVTAVAS